MKFYFFTLLSLLIFSCSIDNSFEDLSPNNGFDSEYWFDAPGFSAALEEVKTSAEDVGVVKTTSKPEHLYFNNALGRLADTAWVSTDTFAFESRDYQGVLNKIVSTAERRGEIVNTRQEGLKWKNLGGIGAFSKPASKNRDAYYLVPMRVAKDKLIWLKVIRKVDKENPFGAYFYTAHGLWLEGDFEVLEKGGNIS